MKINVLTLLFLAGLIGSTKTSAQITITFPMEKAVFQRDLTNKATLNIAGSYNTAISSIEARVTNLISNQITRDWTSFGSVINGGIFTISLKDLPGGWYRVDIRAKNSSNTIVGTATLNNVGIGEVFIIAGQSNAQGQVGDWAEVGATDERVVSHNEITWYDYTLNQCVTRYPSYPSFSKIFVNSTDNTKSNISKTGPSPWCYGKLGDNLVSRLGVPVVFFNAASEGTSSGNWRDGASEQFTKSAYSQLTFCSNEVGAPYAQLKKTLKYYTQTFGARAILWHQGETDNYLGNVTSTQYQANVNFVINKSRQDLGDNIPWVISRASVTDITANNYQGNPNSQIIAAQTALVNTANQIFSGPATDDIQGRNIADKIHFYGSGLIELANRWNLALNTSFFTNATPILPKSLPTPTVTCLNSSTQRITAPNGYSSYKWIKLDNGNEDFDDPAESTEKFIDRSNGTYRCYMTDALGRISFTQTVTVQNLTQTCTCTSMTYLSDVQPNWANNGWGPIEMDQSNGNNAAGDGTTIKIKGKSYTKGIGVHANSEISYPLNGLYGSILAEIGIDDEVLDATAGTANVRFKIFTDNNLKYDSGIIDRSSPITKMNVSVANANTLRLVVEDGNGEFYADHADWAKLRLHCVDNTAPAAPNPLSATGVSQNCLTLQWTASTDNMEVEKYIIYRNNQQFAAVGSDTLSYFMPNLTPQTNYSFTVIAVDFAGNQSVASNVLNVTTLSNLTLSFSRKTINIGQSSTLTATGCTGGTVVWSNGSTLSSINVSPSSTTVYTAFCRVGTCTSTVVQDTVKVIPNCQTNIALQRNQDNISGSVNNLSYSASQYIGANNIVNTNAKATYNAGNAILLAPGFMADSGTVFEAKIQGCSNGLPGAKKTTESVPISKKYLKKK